MKKLMLFYILIFALLFPSIPSSAVEMSISMFSSVSDISESDKKTNIDSQRNEFSISDNPSESDKKTNVDSQRNEFSISDNPSESSAETDFSDGDFTVSDNNTQLDSETEEEITELDFFLSIEQQMETNFLMGEVVLPFSLGEEKKISAEVYIASTEGEFEPILYHEWDNSGQKLKRICMYPTYSPFKEYLEKNIDSLWVYMEVNLPDGTVQKTKTAHISRSSEDDSFSSMEEDGISVNGVFSPSLRKKNVPGKYYGEYHITATTVDAIEDYIECLPISIPIQLQFIQNDSTNIEKIYTQYSVTWDIENPQILSEEDKVSYQYKAICLTAPNQPLNFEFNQKKYQLQPEQYPQFLLQPDSIFQELYCIVHPVEQGYETPLKLSVTGEIEKVLSVIFPLKPSEVQLISSFISINGEKEVYQGDIDLETYPVNSIPNQQEYVAPIMSLEQAKVLLEEGNGSFQLRLMIMGGPLGNAIRGRYTYSKPVIWSGEEKDISPDNPDDGIGGEGNQGNAGTDNSGDTQGIRPGTEDTYSKPSQDIIESFTEEIVTEEIVTEELTTVPISTEEETKEWKKETTSYETSEESSIEESSAEEFFTEESVTEEENSLEDNTLESLSEETTEQTESVLHTQNQQAKKEAALAAFAGILAVSILAFKKGLFIKLINSIRKWF